MRVNRYPAMSRTRCARTAKMIRFPQWSTYPKARENDGFVVPPFSSAFPYYRNLVKSTLEATFVPPVESGRWTSWKHWLGSFFAGKGEASAATLRATQSEQQELARDLPSRLAVKVVVIGLHGWFPRNTLVQTVFGELIGTSEKFCELMADALNGNEKLAIDSIELIPLVGHGKVSKRVESYLELLMTVHLDTLSQATHIVLASHSQGSAVAISLLSQLILKQVLDPAEQHILTLCMAGILHGPFPTLKSSMVIQYFEADAARELFDFCEGGLQGEEDSRTLQLETEAADTLWNDMKFILESNVDVVLVGSWRDQVVPLYSSLMTSFQHSNILRAVYIDRHNFADDFLTRLIVFLVKLRNAGLFDDHLLYLLSDVVSGSIYSGVEHSTIYDDEKVYEYSCQDVRLSDPGSIAVDWLLRERQSAATNVSYMPFKISSRPNPYYIPWKMNALLSRLKVELAEYPELEKELLQLLDSYGTWKPSDKSARELRYRLEPIKSHL